MNGNFERLDIIQKEAQRRLEEIQDQHRYNSRRLEEEASDVIVKTRKKLDDLLEEYDREFSFRRAKLEELLEEFEAKIRHLEELRNGY